MEKKIVGKLKELLGEKSIVVYGLEKIARPLSTHRVYSINSSSGKIIIKVYTTNSHYALQREVWALQTLNEITNKIPQILFFDTRPFNFLVTNFIEGKSLLQILTKENSYLFSRQVISEQLKISESTKKSYALMSRQVDSFQFSKEVIKHYSNRITLTSNFERTKIISLLRHWSNVLNPSFFSLISFDCRLRHFIFNEDVLSGILDFEHANFYDPLFDIAKLVFDLIEEIPSVEIKTSFFDGIYQELSNYYHRDLIRLPFYIAIQYLTDLRYKSISASTQYRLFRSACFWLNEIPNNSNLSNWLREKIITNDYRISSQMIRP